MARRPRRRYVTTEVTPASMFGLDKLLNLGAIPIITAIITLIGFYYSTNSSLQRHSEEIKAGLTQVESVKKLVTDKTQDDTVARSKIREDFLASQVKTAEGIAKLDTRLAVAETQQATANQQLQKISDTLEKLSNFAIGGSNQSKR